MIRHFFRPHLTGAVLLSLVVSSGVAQAQAGAAKTTTVLPDSAVVAVVLGQPVTYGEIQINSFANHAPIQAPKGAGTAFGSNSGFPMNQDMQDRFAGMRLGELISQRLRGSLMVREHLQVTPAQVAASKKEMETEMFNGQSLNQYLAQKRAKLLALKKALDEVMQGKNADQVYKTEVASQLNPQFWQMEVQAYKSPEGRRGLQTAIDADKSQFYEARIAAMAPEMAEREAVDHFVDNTLSASDAKFKKDLALAQPDQPALIYLNQKRSAWWRGQVEQNVVFKVERFRAPAEQFSSNLGGFRGSAFAHGPFAHGSGMVRTPMGAAGPRPGV